MAVFALNYAHATGESALRVEPVRLSDAGIQVGVGEDLQLSAHGDVNDLVHRVALGCFPNAPVTRCISEKARSAFAAHLVVACMLSAAKRQLSSAKHLTIGVWVAGSIVDVAANYLFG